MQFSVVALLVAAATGAVANSNVTYTTEVVASYVTYCPEATVITHADKTYTVTKATTLTFDCPCTVTKPVYTTSSVICHTCVSHNATSAVVKPTPTPTKSVVQAGATKIAALSGGALAAVLGFAAFL